MDGAEGRCLERAAKKEGVIHRVQALGLGLSDDKIEVKLRNRRWVVVLPRVYRVEGSPVSWLQSLRAISLWADRDFAISHRSAAALMRLARFREGPLEVSVKRNLSLPAPIVVHRVTELHYKDVRILRDLRVTSPARTLVDLCGGEDRQTLEATADEMLRRKWVSLDEIESALDRLPRRRGGSFLNDLVRRYRGGEPPAESELEARAIELIDNAGLPRPAKQVPVNAGRRNYRLDLFYPSQRVVIEAASFLHHSDPIASERDRIRKNALTSRGLLVLEWTWDAIRTNGDRLAGELANALGM
jgi:very-short-patch-repair endonuclease